MAYNGLVACGHFYVMNKRKDYIFWYCGKEYDIWPTSQTTVIATGVALHISFSFVTTSTFTAEEDSYI